MPPFEPGELRFRILLSYWYYKTVDLDELFAKYFTKPYPDTFADSGAYSAMTQGVEITPEEYGDWIERYGHLFSAYSNLDVIKNARATWENQRILEDRGLNPVPVFHVLEPWEWLERYIDNYRYVALGVAGMQQRKGIMPWLIKCFRMARGEGGEPQTVYHGFALTSWDVMRSFPWYSVDSSSWGQGFRYGIVPLFDWSGGRWIKLKLGDRSGWHKHARLVQDMGFDPGDFADRSRNTRDKLCAISALAYILAERYLREVHGEIRLPGNGGEPGIKSHLVDARGGRTSYNDLAMAERGLKTYLGDSGFTPLKDPSMARRVLGEVGCVQD